MPMVIKAILSCLHIDHTDLSSGVVSRMPIVGAVIGLAFFSSIHHGDYFHYATGAASFGHAFTLSKVKMLLR
ncbi:TPA: hypothetical protein MAO31_002011 [Klebsiella pneumoniae]|nr:hypothetical protein [Klebsiella pneumoniae]HDT0686857.1 hypothetical protein [Klebsiella aerogenes]